MKLGIIIPTIGRPTLHEVLKSLLQQIKHNSLSNQVHIYIGVDDTKDSQSQLTRQYTNKCISFLYTNHPRSGAANARNLCLEKATKDYDLIAFIGDDTIPDKNWITNTISWHSLNPQPNHALLGRVYWHKTLINDPLHKWLDGNIQFDFSRLDKGYNPDWRHFTTSNLSLKSSLLLSPNNFFNTNFKGWGFEDGELGYRLTKQKSLKIFYNPSIKVFHDHKQSFPKVISNIKNARRNALLFQQIHPEQKILPTNLKKILLLLTAYSIYPIPFFLSPKAYWWSRCKLTWLGKNLKQFDQ